MNKTVEIVNPLEQDDWNKMISSDSMSSPFLTSNWARVLKDSYGYKPVYFVSREDGRVKCILPMMEVNSPLTGHRGVSLPFSDYCTPEMCHPGDAFTLLHDVIEFGRKRHWRYCEFRGGTDFPPDIIPYAEFTGHSLQLSHNEQEVEARFKTRTKRCIKKALAHGVTAEVARSEKALRAFYCLHCQTRRRHGLPPQPYSFFMNIYRNILQEDMGFIVLALYRNRPVAGALYMHFNGEALYKYSASDDRYPNFCGSSVALWGAIMWCCAHRIKRLSFGRCARNNEGLRYFKLGWGTREYPVPYYRFNIRHNCFIEAAGETKEPGVAALSRLPVSFLRVIGKVAYRHMG